MDTCRAMLPPSRSRLGWRWILEPYTLDEIRAILTAAQQRRNAARWAIALALGLRQGEVLGLKWADVNLDQGLLRIRSTRTRPRYEHGCGEDCVTAATVLLILGVPERTVMGIMGWSSTQWLLAISTSPIPIGETLLPAWAASSG